ncbi:hypothetical protein J132_03068 [Termitomyces sp. J132]|nr:hypothetical protein J132_03068 [Termitomyces sp. J132]
MGHKGKNGQSSIACASEEPTVQGTTCATTHTGRGTAPGDIPLETIVESVNAFEGLGEQAMHETSAIPFDMAHKIIMQHSSTTTGSHPSAASSLQRQSTSIQVNSLERASNAYGISHTIYPLLPEKIPRYHRNRYLSSEPEELKLSAGQQKLTLGNIPSGWEQLIHPEGQPYFYHANKRIITENWIYDPKEMRILDGFISQIENFTQSKGQNQTRDAHLVLECNQEDGVSWCGYYYVSASTRSVFWLEALDLSNINGELVLPQIELYLEYQYWYHWNLFPHVNECSNSIYDLVANAIVDARTDVISSNESTVNHTSEELKEMGNIVKHASSEAKAVCQFELVYRPVHVNAEWVVLTRVAVCGDD